MRVLVACEFSGVVRDAFIERGHDAWSCDIEPTESRPERHFQIDAIEVAKSQEWDLLIAHPPCTYLTNAGVRHLHDHVKSRKGNRAGVYGSKRWVALHDSAMFFRSFMELSIGKVCVENPIPHKYARNIIGKYTQIIQPWQFGHGETKATCLWLKGLPDLVPTDIVEGREPRIHRMSPGPDRAKERSRTFAGIAKAMANQWG